jgi:hypothetical protein
MALRIPVDMALASFLSAGEPTAYVDRTTGRQRTDVNGAALYNVPLLAMADGVAEVVVVRVPHQPANLVQGAPVRLTGLTAQYWENEGRSGISYRATRVEPAGPAHTAKAAS